MKDYQRYWYHALCMEACYSERPGMIPNNLDILYRLSGCTASREFFVRNSDVVVDAFRVSECGKWLISDRALQISEVLHSGQTIEKKQRRKTSSFLLDSTLSVPIYENYPRKEGRKTALEAIQKAIHRLAFEPQYESDRQKHGIPLGEDTAAAAFLFKQAARYAESPAGKREDRSFIPHPSTWFNQDRFLDDASTWDIDGSHRPILVKRKADLDELYGK